MTVTEVPAKVWEVTVLSPKHEVVRLVGRFNTEVEAERAQHDATPDHTAGYSSRALVPNPAYGEVVS